MMVIIVIECVLSAMTFICERFCESWSQWFENPRLPLVFQITWLWSTLTYRFSNEHYHLQNMLMYDYLTSAALWLCTCMRLVLRKENIARANTVIECYQNNKNYSWNTVTINYQLYISIGHSLKTGIAKTIYSYKWRQRIIFMKNI